MMKRQTMHRLMLTALPLLLAGCHNLTGLMNAADEFGCPLSAGVSCSTISDTYGRLEKEKKAGQERENAALAGLAALRPEKEEGRREDASVSGKADKADKEKKSADARGGSKKPKGKAVPGGKRIEKRMARLNEALYPSRAREQVVQIRVLPWVDESGDLHGAQSLWMRVADAHWRVEHLRQRVIDRALSDAD